MTYRALAVLTALVFLGACGADGPPQKPASKTPQPGISLTGEVLLGAQVEL